MTVAVAASSPTSAVGTFAAITAASAAAGAAIEALAGGAFFARASLVDGQGAALKVFLMEHGDGFFGVCLGGHFDERKAAGTARGSILHDADRNDAAGLGKVVLQVIFG